MIKGSVRGHGSRRDRYYTANPEFITSGKVKEGPCPPDVKSEQFSSWLKRRDIIGAFFGHDHVNDFSGEYNIFSIINCIVFGFTLLLYLTDVIKNKLCGFCTYG